MEQTPPAGRRHALSQPAPRRSANYCANAATHAAIAWRLARLSCRHCAFDAKDPGRAQSRSKTRLGNGTRGGTRETATADTPGAPQNRKPEDVHPGAACAGPDRVWTN